MTHAARQAIALVALPFVMLAAVACSDDKEKAKKERAAIEKRVTDSFALVPYRGLKTMMRSSKGTRPPEVDKVAKDLDDAFTRFSTELAANQLPLKATVELLVGAYRARAVLKKHDEDHFALLATVFANGPLPLPAFYDNGAEHMALGVTWILLGLLDHTGQLPTPEILFYELSRVEAKPAWPWFLRTLGRGLRGVAQCHAGYHYAAEEELSALVVEVESATAADRAPLVIRQLDNWVDAELRAGAHLLRAWNRFGLGRNDKAIEDLEAALQQLDRLGIDNELTQWAWAIVHAHHKRYEEAGKSLDKLAASPHLDEAARTEIKQAAVDVRKAGKDFLPLTGLRSSYYIARALVARAGGLEPLLDALLGPELAAKVKAPLLWVRAVQHSAGDLLDEKQLDAAAEKAKAGGQKLLDAGKGLFEKIKK